MVRLIIILFNLMTFLLFVILNMYQYKLKDISASEYQPHSGT